VQILVHTNRRARDDGKHPAWTGRDRPTDGDGEGTAGRTNAMKSTGAAAEAGEGSPERRDEGTALHSLRIFLFVVCVGSTSHQQQRGMSSSGCRKLFFPRGIAHAGSSDRLMRGSVRFGSCVTSVKCESDEVFFVSIKTVGRPQTGVKCVSKMSQPRENRARARMCVC